MALRTEDLIAARGTVWIAEKVEARTVLAFRSQGYGHDAWIRNGLVVPPRVLAEMFPEAVLRYLGPIEGHEIKIVGSGRRGTGHSAVCLCRFWGPNVETTELAYEDGLGHLHAQLYGTEEPGSPIREELDAPHHKAELLTFPGSPDLYRTVCKDPSCFWQGDNLQDRSEAVGQGKAHEREMHPEEPGRSILEPGRPILESYPKPPATDQEHAMVLALQGLTAMLARPRLSDLREQMVYAERLATAMEAKAQRYGEPPGNRARAAELREEARVWKARAEKVKARIAALYDGEETP